MLCLEISVYFLFPHCIQLLVPFGTVWIICNFFWYIVAVIVPHPSSSQTPFTIWKFFSICAGLSRLNSLIKLVPGHWAESPSNQNSGCLWLKWNLLMYKPVKHYFSFVKLNFIQWTYKTCTVLFLVELAQAFFVIILKRVETMNSAIPNILQNCFFLKNIENIYSIYEKLSLF
jgi:hypothetical protein